MIFYFHVIAHNQKTITVNCHQELEMQSAKLNNALHDAKIALFQIMHFVRKEKCNSASCTASFLALFLKMQSTGVNIVRLTSNFCQNLIIFA